MKRKRLSAVKMIKMMSAARIPNVPTTRRLPRKPKPTRDRIADES